MSRRHLLKQPWRSLPLWLLLSIHAVVALPLFLSVHVWYGIVRGVRRAVEEFSREHQILGKLDQGDS